MCHAEECKSPCTSDRDCTGGSICFVGFCEVGDRPPGDDIRGGDPPAGGDVLQTGDVGAPGDRMPSGDTAMPGDPPVANPCGNGVRDGTEVCDGMDLGSTSQCSALGYVSGTLTCFPNCMDYDRSLCGGPPGSCGNGNRQGQEQCDTNDLNGATCESLGFLSGTLTCAAQCGFDVSGCLTP